MEQRRNGGRERGQKHTGGMGVMGAEAFWGQVQRGRGIMGAGGGSRGVMGACGEEAEAF